MASAASHVMSRPSSAGVYAWYVAALLATGHLVSFVDRFVMSLVMEPLKADLGVSDAQLGLLQGTGFVILYTAVAIPLGLMADRVNRRNLIIAGILLWSIATAACGLATSFGSLFLARIGVGFGEAALVPSAMSLLASLFPRRQLGRAVSLFTAGASLGKSAALIGGGTVLALLVASGGLHLGAHTFKPWQGTFIIMALPGLVLAALLLTVREPERAASTVARPNLATALATLRANRLAYGLHTAAAALVVLEIQGLAAWAVSFFVRYYAMTPAQSGVTVGTIILFAAPLGHLAGGLLTDLFQKRGTRAPAAPVIALGLVCVIPAALLFTQARSLPVALTGYGLLNFFGTMSAPASLAGVQMLTSERLRGVITSMFLAVTTFVGVGLGPALIGLASDSIGGAEGLRAALTLIMPTVAVLGIALALVSRAPFARTAQAVLAPQS